MFYINSYKIFLKVLFPILFFPILYSCSAPKEAIGASWEGESDFMFISKKTMQMNYASYIEGKSVFLGGFYEIVQNETNSVINTIEVTDIEFEKRTDGVFYCRVWGNVQRSEDQGYLLADNCHPIFN